MMSNTSGPAPVNTHLPSGSTYRNLGVAVLTYIRSMALLLKDGNSSSSHDKTPV